MPFKTEINTDGYLRIKPEQMNIRGCERLIIAMVHKAVWDYKYGTPKRRQEAIEFFNSQTFYGLTGLRAKWIMQQADKYEPVKSEELMFNMDKYGLL